MPLDDVLKTLIAEAAGEDDEGMYAVASTFVNRAKRRGKTLQQIVNENSVNTKGVRVWQYTGRARPDLDRFVAQQGPQAADRARRALDRAQQQPMPGLDHYLTNDLYKKIESTSRTKPHWSQTMGGRRTIGNHLFMDSRQQWSPPSTRPVRPQSALPQPGGSPMQQMAGMEDRLYELDQGLKQAGIGPMSPEVMREVAKHLNDPAVQQMGTQQLIAQVQQAMQSRQPKQPGLMAQQARPPQPMPGLMQRTA